MKSYFILAILFQKVWIPWSDSWFKLKNELKPNKNDKHVASIRNLLAYSRFLMNKKHIKWR